MSASSAGCRPHQRMPCGGEHNASGIGARDNPLAQGDSTRGAVRWSRNSGRGWVWQRRMHLGMEKPAGVSLCPRSRPRAWFSFPGVCPRGAAVTGSGEEAKGQDVRAPGLSRFGCQDPCTYLTVRPSWHTWHPSSTNYYFSAQQRGTRQPREDTALGHSWARRALQGLCEAPRVQGRGRKTPRPPRRQPCPSPAMA